MRAPPVLNHLGLLLLEKQVEGLIGPTSPTWDAPLLRLLTCLALLELGDWLVSSSTYRCLCFYVVHVRMVIVLEIGDWHVSSSTYWCVCFYVVHARAVVVPDGLC
jgi:hypothetical protein